MSDTLNFEKSAEWFMCRSKLWSKRGDDYKSLLYARRAFDGGSLRGKIRMAKALYESGNFHRAYDVYLSLYRTEAHTEEVCVGIIKCLFGMSNNRSLVQFMTDAAEEGVLMTGANHLASGNNVKALSEILKAYPDEFDNKDFAKLAYLYFADYISDSEVMFREINFADDMALGGMDAVLAAASIPGLSKFTDELALKTIKTCDDVLDDEEAYNVYEMLSLKIVCLVKLDRIDEAYDVADELLGLPFPDDNLKLLKCANALIALGDSDGALDYLEELMLETYNEVLVLFTAIANMNEGHYDRAKELFANVLLINPSNLVAKYWTAKLCTNRKKGLKSKFAYALPAPEEIKVRSSIDKLYEEAEVCGKVEETPEMSDRLKYELERANLDFSTFVARRTASHDIYPDVLEWYLCNPRGALSIKRDLLLEMLCVNHNRAVPMFIYGLRNERVKVDLDGCSSQLRRAYAAALTTVWIFLPEDYHKLDGLFTNVYPLLESIELKTETDIMSLAAALLYLSRFSHIDSEKMASDLFMQARVGKLNEYYKLISGVYPQYERSKKKSKKQ